MAALPTSVDRSIRLRSGSAQGGEGACRVFSAVAGGTLTVSADLMIDSESRSAGEPLMSVMASDIEIASLTPGADQLAADTWYRATVVVRFEDRRLDIELADRTSGDAVIPSASQDLAVPENPTVDRVCFIVPSAEEPASLYLDNVNVRG